MVAGLTLKTSEAFVEYAVTLFEEFNGLVGLWATFNEPWCISFLSHQMGKHAPVLRIINCPQGGSSPTDCSR